MNEDRQSLVHLHSNEIINGEGKIPTSGSVEYGEIAIGYADGHETIFIRNDSDEIISFSCDDKFNESFRVMSKAMCDLDDRVLALEEISALTVGDLIETTTELENVSSSGKTVDAIIIKGINNRLTGAETSAGTLNSAVNTLESSATSANTRITTLESSATSVNTRLDNLDSSATSANTRITTLESSATSVNTRLDGLENSAGTFNTRISDLEASAITVNDVIYDENTFKNVSTSGKVVDAMVIKNAINEISPMVETTWSALKSLRDSSGLTPGMQYRITDYNTTTSQANTQAAGHQFDIIVVADNEYTLNENARAVLHSRDTYFSDSGAKLESWELKYCLDNDTTRFTWAKNLLSPESNQKVILVNDIGDRYIYVRYPAGDNANGLAWAYDTTGDGLADTIEYVQRGEEDLDTSDIIYTQSEDIHIDDVLDMAGKPVSVVDTSWGRGVIYRMIDEWNNDFPYDFKNIQFTMNGFVAYFEGYQFSMDSTDTFLRASSNDRNNYYAWYCQKHSEYCYTDTETPIISTTLYHYNTDEDVFEQDGGNIKMIYSNITNAYTFTRSVSSVYVDASLGNNSTSFCYGNKIGDSIDYASKRKKIPFIVFLSTGTSLKCYSNNFKENCNYNMFGNTCIGNLFGNNCDGNLFGNYCSNNSFGNDCNYNSFGNNCTYNKFGNGCGDNTFVSCGNNSFGNVCRNNSFGNGCNYNSFGNYCNNNSFGNNCGNNTFGNNCGNNSFGSVCSNNLFGLNYSNNLFGNRCEGNSFGNNCRNNSFGNGCNNNSFGNECGNNSFVANNGGNSFGCSCRYIRIQKEFVIDIIVENGNKYIDITSTQTTSSSNLLRNFKISQGVNNTTPIKTISHNTLNDTFRTTYQPANSQIISI